MYQYFENRLSSWKYLLRIEGKLLLFILYIGFLIFLWIKSHSLLTVLYTHLFIVLLSGVYNFGTKFLLILIAPIIFVLVPVEQYFIKRFIKKYSQNTPVEVAVILGHSDWSKLEAWVKPNAFLSEIKLLVQLLTIKKQNFSFYPNATPADVEGVMRDETIQEVYLLGHGSSHSFQLRTDDILYYCEFNHPQYKKKFVHQIHCGTKSGKSLVDYVVPNKNKSGCFFIREEITVARVEKELKKRIEEQSVKIDRDYTK